MAISTLFSGLAGYGLDTASLVGRRRRRAPATCTPGCFAVVPAAAAAPIGPMPACLPACLTISADACCVPVRALALWLCLQPPTPSSTDMRGIVHQAIEEARRIPDVPPVPIDYSSVLAGIREWIEQLEATQSEVAAAQQVGSVQRCCPATSHTVPLRLCGTVCCLHQLSTPWPGSECRRPSSSARRTMLRRPLLRRTSLMRPGTAWLGSGRNGCKRQQSVQQ